jgi:hypothetical protein
MGPVSYLCITIHCTNPGDILSYSYHSNRHLSLHLGIANYAYFAVPRSKWFIAIGCSIYLFSVGEDFTGILAILWPAITIFIAAILPVDIEYIEKVFYDQWHRYTRESS